MATPARTQTINSQIAQARTGLEAERQRLDSLRTQQAELASSLISMREERKKLKGTTNPEKIKRSQELFTRIDTLQDRYRSFNKQIKNNRIDTLSRRISKLRDRLPENVEARRTRAKQASLENLRAREARGEITDVQVLRDQQRANRARPASEPDVTILASRGRVIASARTNEEREELLAANQRLAQSQRTARSNAITVSPAYAQLQERRRTEINRARNTQRINRSRQTARDFAQREDFAAGASIPASTQSGEGVTGLATYGREITGTVTAQGGGTVANAPIIRSLRGGFSEGFGNYPEATRNLRAGGQRNIYGFAENVGRTAGVAGRIGYEYTLGRVIGAGANIAGRTATYGIAVRGRQIIPALGLTGARNTQRIIAAGGIGLAGASAAGYAASDRTGRQRILERAFIGIPAGGAGFSRSNVGLRVTSQAPESAGTTNIFPLASGRLRTISRQQREVRLSVFGRPERATQTSTTTLRGVPVNQNEYLVRGTQRNTLEVQGLRGTITDSQRVRGSINLETGSSILLTPQTATIAAPELTNSRRSLLTGIQVSNRGRITDFSTINTASGASNTRRAFNIPQRGILAEVQVRGGGTGTQRTAQQTTTRTQAENTLRRLGFTTQRPTQRLYADPTGGLLTSISRSTQRNTIRAPRTGIRTTPNVGIPLGRTSFPSNNLLQIGILGLQGRTTQRTPQVSTFTPFTQQTRPETNLASLSNNRMLTNNAQNTRILRDTRTTPNTAQLFNTEILITQGFIPAQTTPTFPTGGGTTPPPPPPFIGIPPFGMPTAGGSNRRRTATRGRGRGFQYVPDLISSLTRRTTTNNNPTIGLFARPIRRR